MSRSRKIFLFAAALFVAFLAFTIYDISRRTTFPGSKKAKKEAPADTIQGRSSSKSATQQP
ncbi:MAG: hypothetical protein JNN04_10075 [Cyclobacteriaceae bacterium]|nr:hypothetical protein [Cyclobacteriaceae bacterium]